MTVSKFLKSVFAIAVVCFTAAARLYAQDKDLPKELYIAAGIPDSLKEDANSVVRYSMDDITVKGPGRMYIKHHTITTILNEKGDGEAIVQMVYNRKFDTYSYVDIHIYDATGKMIKKYHKSDMYDGLASDDETLVSDDRFLGLKHMVSAYPETIEVSSEEDITSSIDLGSWLIQKEEQSVQNSYYHITISNDAGFRFQDRNTTINPAKTSAGNMDSYVWQAKNLKAIKPEEGAALWRVLPLVRFTANKFQFYGIPGDISTWQNFGKWIQDLNADVCTLSPKRVDEIRKMTDTIKTDKDKAKFLYKYMQQSMRYVSIQLGIGGFKPFPATFVDEKKYGDCKALSNYMRALLKAVNINAYYAVIKGGINQEPANYSFSYNSFNHIVLCIPFKNDTTWLECTSNTQPFGLLGAFTENRNAMLITETGGLLVNTPKSTVFENQFNSETHIQLDGEGGAKAQIKILSTGEYRNMYIGMATIKMDEQKEFLLRYLNIKQPSMFNFESGRDADGVKEINLNMEYDRFCDVMAGDKQFYKPAAFSLLNFTVPILEKRKSDYYFDHPMQKTCITTIDLPVGFEVETLPANVSLKFSYGNYEVNYTYDTAKNEVISKAKFVLNNQVIPAAKYTELQQYMDGIAKAQNRKLVIRKKA